MSSTLSSTLVQSVLTTTQLVHPAIGDAAPCCSNALRLIQELGLPAEVGDWFVALDMVRAYDHVGEVQFTVGEATIVVDDAIAIGRNEFGDVIVDCHSGAVVYVDSDGRTQLINTSIERFLYFAGRFQQSADNRFVDVADLAQELQTIDLIPLADRNGIWSVMLEGAQTGMY